MPAVDRPFPCTALSGTLIGLAGTNSTDGRSAIPSFQADREEDFSAAVERLTLRRVVAFMSANQTAPGIACEMFFLDPIETAR